MRYVGVTTFSLVGECCGLDLQVRMDNIPRRTMSRTDVCGPPLDFLAAQTFAAQRNPLEWSWEVNHHGLGIRHWLSAASLVVPLRRFCCTLPSISWLLPT